MSDSPLICVDGTETRLFNSSIVSDTYRLFIVLPDKYHQSNKTYPVLYVTDGNELTMLVRFIVRALQAEWAMPQVIIVGIGYDTDAYLDLARVRERDFLPTNDPSYIKQNRREPYQAVGQANLFLRFIREELKPFIHNHYRTKPEDGTYMGNSHGGLFGLYTLFQQPDSFKRYVISSPSIHHDNQVVLTYDQTYANQHRDLNAKVFLSVGAREEIDDPLIRPSFQFVTNVRTLTQTITDRNYPNLLFASHIFDEETHASVVTSSYTRGLRFVFT